MSDYLPADIWREILLKLPVESLIRTTTVCKSWKYLIVSQDFIYAHLSLSKNNSILRGYDEHDKHHHHLSPQFTQIGINGFLHIHPEISFKPKSWVYDVVGFCDGIVCVTDWYSRVTLWNPSVRNHVELPQPPQSIINRKGPHEVLLGFGMANHVYKVVCLGYGSMRDGAEIFSIGTEGWRSVCGFDIKLRCFTSNTLRCTRPQVLVDGIIHWLGYEPFDDTRSRSSILSFDLGDEVFGEVMLPDVLVMDYVPYLRLHKIEGSLAVVLSGEYFIDVWVMKEYGVKASWTKLYTIDLPKVNKIVNGFFGHKNVKAFFEIIGFRNGEALLKYNVPSQICPDLVSYNLETKHVKDLGISGTRNSFYIDDYVESLLLLKGSNVSVVEEIREPLMEGLDIKKD